jgi:predicted ribonuclease YlaK
MGSKLLVLGDPAQIDNPLCTRDVNGLTHAIKHYLPMPYSALIHLPKNYRSQLSEDSNSVECV